MAKLKDLSATRRELNYLLIEVGCNVPPGRMPCLSCFRLLLEAEGVSDTEAQRLWEVVVLLMPGHPRDLRQGPRMYLTGRDANDRLERLLAVLLARRRRQVACEQSENLSPPEHEFLYPEGIEKGYPIPPSTRRGNAATAWGRAAPGIH